ncbi:MAG: type II CRISPR-associated endonuclease Cas1 [Gammaproteobacteria bacterium]|nr:type II CRISPR-associated endonuclease Cas1 [Gammaproteobacteria bacterium]
MADQIVEITQPHYRLSKSRGFLHVHDGGKRIGQVPLDDILTVIVSVPGCSISTVLIDHLCQKNVPLVICSSNYLPTSFTLPTQGFGRQFQIMRSQAMLSEPKRKRVWKKIVQAKINNQAQLLKNIGEKHLALTRLSKKVKSGDPENVEAQAARIYWQKIFGSNFRRDRHGSGLNAALNYVYTVVRACVARGVSSAGLHPSFSLHHKNPQNPINLVDDLIEPFRPIADFHLWKMGLFDISEITPSIKAHLASVVIQSIPLGNQNSPLSLAAVKTCRSYAAYCLGETREITVPAMPTEM